MDIEDRRTTTVTTTAISSNHTQYGLIERIEIILNFLNHLIISFVTIYMTYLCIKSGLVNTSLHAWLSTLGYQLLMAEGILGFYSNNMWSLVLLNTRKNKTTVHWILMLMGSVLAIVGAIYKIVYKGPHFHSIHSITGLIATIIVAFNLISGLAALYSQTLKKFITPLYNKTFHSFLGLTGFVIGMISLYYGYSTGFLRKRVESDFLEVLKVITILTILLTVIGPIRTLYRNFKLVFV